MHNQKKNGKFKTKEKENTKDKTKKKISEGFVKIKYSRGNAPFSVGKIQKKRNSSLKKKQKQAVKKNE
jgi:hypothetical protein